jgi:hypothetical protein
MRITRETGVPVEGSWADWIAGIVALLKGPGPAETTIEAAKRKGVHTERYGNQVFRATENVMSTYFCLPDTMDPRGPKGK